MKRITLLLTVVLFAALASAQVKVKPAEGLLERTKAPASIEKLTPAQRKNVVGTRTDGIVRLNMGKFKDMPAAKKAPKKVEKANAPEIDFNVISEQPEGELNTYSRSGYGFLSFFGYIMTASQGGSVIDIVTAPDGKTVYLKDIVSQAIAETWVKGTIEGNKIHVPMYQSIIYYGDDYGYGLCITKMDYVTVEEDGETYQTYQPDFTADEMTFTINEDGTISLDGTETNASGFGESILGLIYTDDFSWAGYGDYQSVYTEFNDVAQTMPEGLNVEEWSYMYSENGYRYGTILNAAIDGDKIYIKGVSQYDPESVIVGTVSGDKVTFASDQFMGTGSGYILYFCGAGVKTEEVWDEYNEEYYTDYDYTYIPELVMDYDAEKKTLTSSDDYAVLINLGKGSETIYYMTAGINPCFAYFEDVAATPATPEVVTVNESYFDSYGYNYVSLNVKTEDVDGNFIDPNKMAYILWVKVDGEAEQFVFYSDEYVGLQEEGLDELTEVPYTFTIYDADGYEDVSEGGSAIYLYQTGFDDYGVQSVYYGGGERRVSDISWYSGNGTSGIKGLSVTGSTKVKAIYSIDGRKLDAPSKGINIMLMDDGSVRKVVTKR